MTPGFVLRARSGERGPTMKLACDYKTVSSDNRKMEVGASKNHLNRRASKIKQQQKTKLKSGISAINIHVRASVRTEVFSSFGCVSRRLTAGSDAESQFSFVRNHQFVFQSGCPVLHSCQQCSKVATTPYPHQTSRLLSVLRIFAILMGVQWYLRFLLLCNSLMTEDGEYPFTPYVPSIEVVL